MEKPKITSSRGPVIGPWRGEVPEPCHDQFLRAPEAKIAWPEGPREKVEVAVVGAGLAGLTAAYHLRDRQVVVLEAETQAGGVCLSGSYQGVPYPAGSAYFYYPWNDEWRKWYRDLELDTDAALVADPSSALYFRGEFFPDCFSERGLKKLPLSPQVMDELRRFAHDLAAWEAEWEPLGSEGLIHPELDRFSFQHYLEKIRGLPPEATSLFAPYCASCLGAGPETVSAWAALYFLMSEFSPANRTAAFPEGNARLIQALLKALPAEPRVQQVAAGVRQEKDAVQLLVFDAGQKRTYCLEAGAVILAVGKFAAQKLLSAEAGWSPEDFRFFRYSSYVVAALCGPLSLEAPGYENWVAEERAFTDFILAPRLVRDGGPRVMVAFAPQPFPQGREALLHLSARKKGREILDTAIRLFPGLKNEVEEIRLYRFGHAQIVPYPGFLTRLKQTFKHQHGRIILSSSDSEGLPCIEAAIIQGQKAARLARELLER
ncbi:MAG: FAD-dependent oxidoreductase [Deltaproteobacteria bacterium]|nr:FAD-dependent oxidoreductase [Deltaproteobacteria bacterium]